MVRVIVEPGFQSSVPVVLTVIDVIASAAMTTVSTPPVASAPPLALTSTVQTLHAVKPAVLVAVVSSAPHVPGTGVVVGAFVQVAAV